MKTTEERNIALENAKEHTKRSFKNLWGIVKKYSGGKRKTASQPKEQITKFRYKNKRLLKILKAVPAFLIALFIISFFWDFNGLSWQFLNHTFQFEGLLRILSVSGLIGYGTNYVAITMLFKPVKKRPLLGHGLIPAQKERISIRLAQTVSEDLINPEIIKQKLHESDAISRYRKSSTRYIKTIIDDSAFRAELKAWTYRYVDDMIANPEIRSALAEKILIQIEHSVQKTSLEKAALRAYTFIKGQRMQQIIEDALTGMPDSVETGLDRFDDFLDELPEHIEKNSATIEQFVTSMLYALINKLDVKNLVEDKLRRYDEQRLSDLIWNATNEQLHYIQYLGAVLGVIGGFLIWEPLYCLIFLILLTVTVFVTDYLLLKYSRF